MEVILRVHVDNLGKRGEIVKVADGYARNYLLPRKLALEVTAGNKKIIDRERKVAEAREAEEKQTAEALASRLSQAEISIARRVGETDQLYGSVTSADIAEALAARGLEIEKRKIHLDEPLKSIGEFTVPERKENADETRPLVVSLAGYERTPPIVADVEIRQLAAADSAPVEYRTIELADQLPGLWSIFEEQGKLSAIDPAAGGTAVVTGGDRHYGSRALTLTPAGEFRLAHALDGQTQARRVAVNVRDDTYTHSLSV